MDVITVKTTNYNVLLDLSDSGSYYPIGGPCMGMSLFGLNKENRWAICKVKNIDRPNQIRVHFEDKYDKILTLKEIASFYEYPWHFNIGQRVIFKLDCPANVNIKYYYAGVIQEPPTARNKFM